MAESGHELGLHSNRHDYMQHMTKDEALDDLLENRLAVTEASGITPVLFRPPGGLYSQDLLDASRELGLSIVFWSVDPHVLHRLRAGRAGRRNAFAGDVL